MERLKLTTYFLDLSEFNVPEGYTYANSWGEIFYKTYGAMNYFDAVAQCKDDGAYLAYQRFDGDYLIASLIPNQHSWIGVNDDYWLSPDYPVSKDKWHDWFFNIRDRHDDIYIGGYDGWVSVYEHEIHMDSLVFGDPRSIPDEIYSRGLDVPLKFVCFHDKPKNSKGNISNCIIQLNLKERKDSYVPCEKIIFNPY